MLINLLLKLAKPVRHTPTPHERAVLQARLVSPYPADIEAIEGGPGVLLKVWDSQHPAVLAGPIFPFHRSALAATHVLVPLLPHFLHRRNCRSV